MHHCLFVVVAGAVAGHFSLSPLAANGITYLGNLHCILINHWINKMTFGPFLDGQFFFGVGEHRTNEQRTTNNNRSIEGAKEEERKGINQHTLSLER
jgi:hypothetical protein